MRKEGWARRRKELDLMRARGIDQYVPNDQLVEHLRFLERWWPRTVIAERIGMSPTFVHDHLEGRCVRVHRDHLAKVLAVTVPEDERVTDEDRFLGAQRMARGLIAKGFTSRVIAEHAGMSEESMRSLTSGTNRNWQGMKPWTYERFLRAAEKLDAASPGDYGVCTTAQKTNKTRSVQKHWAPLGCWELAEIHKPDAIPEWTGACGTEQGYQIHYREKHEFPDPELGTVRACGPCREAHREYRRRNPQAPPWEPHAAAVRELIADGLGDTDIAAELGINPRTVERIRKPRRKQ
ncbi:hypothetical protein BJP40_06470 [Streptomyces sp. CC53]|uniref:hypothetical protein n=1 Tax=Streptomyces sp. CC53 TaxID=1906740 RepID=UPI0008DE9C7B|nr:hypothetical protein [Streptomyces sp. CC53]OII61167.1 hypothetical protein BJP40_06470 [Streptomyces sp. CC53]